MWFGTNTGLNRYDGYRMTVYKSDPDDPMSISSNAIEAIIEDKSGFLWIGTNGGGVNRFDPQTERFISFMNYPENPRSLCDNTILRNAIYEDQNSHIWMGTRGGLSQLIARPDEQTQIMYEFKNYRYPTDEDDVYHQNVIHAIYEDEKGHMWAGAQDGSVYQEDRVNEKLIKTVSSDDIYSYINPQNIRWDPGAVMWLKIDYQDQDSILWIGTSKNLLIYSLSKKEFIGVDQNIQNLIANKMIGRITGYAPESGDSILVSTDEGFFFLDDDHEKIIKYSDDLKIEFKLPGKNIFCHFTDRQAINWYGTSDEGVFKDNPNQRKFKYHDIKIDGEPVNVWSVWQDFSSKANTLWLGTEERGLLRYDYETRNVNGFKETINFLITDIYKDSTMPNYLWLGTSRSGLVKINVLSGIVEKQYYPADAISSEISVHNFAAGRSVMSIVGADSGNIWIGTFHGLYHFNPHNETWKVYLHQPDKPNSLSDNKIFVLHRSVYKGEKQLWIGTETKGLVKFLPHSGVFTRYTCNPADKQTLNHNFVTAIYEDPGGTMWIGTSNGLNKFDRDTQVFTRIMDSKRNLSTEIVFIVQDADKNLWLNSKSGLFIYQPKSGELQTMGMSDGLIDGISNRFSSHIGHDDKWFLGGLGGILEYDQRYYRKNKHIPPLVFTDFKIFNQSMKIGNNSNDKKSIIYSDEIVLRYDQAIFSFEFAALDYNQPEKNTYAYQMLGVDPDWVYTDASRRFATYTSLEPGEYTFRLKGANNDQVWNESGISLKVIVLPPWWRTDLAYALYVVLLIVLAAGVWRFQSNRLKMKYQLQLEYLHREKLEEIDRLKSRFFTNISHEFRTPLTLIEGPVRQLHEGNYRGNIEDVYDVILRNTHRLLNLVNQLLDLAKLEANKMRLQVRKQNIIPLLSSLVQSFESLARSKEIELIFNKPDTAVEIYIDRKIVEKIMVNLLANACKFTPDGGRIETDLKLCNGPLLLEKQSLSKKSDGLCACSDALPTEGGYVEISITNSGSYLTPHDTDHIFDRFYQAHEDHSSGQPGTGIGLALCKEMVILHKGTIQVISSEESGTTFTVRLPADAIHFSVHEMSEKRDTVPRLSLKRSAIGNEGDKRMEEKDRISLPLSSSANTGIPLLLIVEDNADVRNYIKGFLEGEYETREASNGKAGYHMALQQMPDLIISDVMMPDIDGYEMTSRLKNDDRTSHIPIILLTAKATAGDKINGYKRGADDYIMKPFEAQELKARVKNLIDQRRKLRQLFMKESIFTLENKIITPLDKKFLEKAVQIIKTHLADTSFNMDTFARELSIGRTTLFKKIMAVVGEPPSELIKRVRLTHAAELLKKKVGNVSEIALEVGFSNPAYFSKCFRKQFGVNPSQYIHTFTFQS